MLQLCCIQFYFIISGDSMNRSVILLSDSKLLFFSFLLILNKDGLIYIELGP